MLNRVTLIGYLGANPEFIKGNFGDLVKLSIATSEKTYNPDPTKNAMRTEWHNVVIFSPKIVDTIKNHFSSSKGQLVYIEGMLRKRKWNDDQGNERIVIEIVLNSRGKFLMLNNSNDKNKVQEKNDDTEIIAEKPMLEDDIPF